jgi:hypothetical protein
MTNEQKPVTFYSKFGSFRIVKDASTRLQVGNQFVWTKSASAQFDRGKYQTSDPEMIAWLRERPRYGLDYFEEQSDMKASQNPVPQEGPKAPTEPPVVVPKQRHGARSTAVNPL